MPDLTIERVVGPVWWRLICRWIDAHHRHHDPPVGWRYGLVAIRGGADVVGVATIGRPVARLGRGAEVTRLCTWGSSRKRYGAASALLIEVARLEPAVFTDTLACESGRSLEAAGWLRDGAPRRPRRWTCPSRPRRPRRDEAFAKQRWRPPNLYPYERDHGDRHAIKEAAAHG